MKISLDWLGDFLKWKETDPERIAECITACTAEVEEIIRQGELLDNCCVGKVLTIEKHPNADKLSLCDVQTDQGKKRVVCGGTNLRVGMRVAFAHVGAKVKWHGEEELVTLEKTKIRGEESEGMICGADELELVEQFPDCTGDTIVDIGDGDDGVGKPLREFLCLNDVVFDIDNHAITHRADLFSHVGMARECVALGLATWKRDPLFKAPKFGKERIPFGFQVDNAKLMPRYCAAYLRIADIGETPDWMKRRLEATGWRPLSTPIDITNYVAMEIGVPLHSFDIGDIKGTVHMRAAKEGEKIVTLDEVERTLPEGALVLSDDEGIFDLLGIMGGLRSSTKESTRHIYLHSASLDPVSIRRTIIATGHRTDAGTVYEKGVPHISAEQGFYRALQLFLEIVPGAAIASGMDSKGDNGTPQPIDLSVAGVNSLLGTQIPAKEMTRTLRNLNFVVKPKRKDLVVTPPLHRLGDIEGAHDVAEEIGRVHGFDDIDPSMPEANIKPPERDKRVHILRDALAECGFTELQPLSLVGPTLLKKCELDPSKAVVVENAFGEEVSLMRTSILPALLEHAERNMLNVDDQLFTFEWGHVFKKGEDEHTELGMLAAARNDTDLKNNPFLTLKQALSHAMERLGYKLSIKNSQNVPPFAHPGRCAELLACDKSIGTLYEVHPSVRNKFGLEDRAAAISLDLSTLFNIEPSVKIPKPIPEFPAVSYDVTTTMDHSKKAEEVLEKIRQSSDLLESVEIVDLYEGKPLEKGQYNLTVRCTYRATDRTLTEEEVKKEQAKIEKLTA